jgi:hypothetical protein
MERTFAALLAREQEARATAEDANRMKDDFLAAFSHELRWVSPGDAGRWSLVGGRLVS